MLLYFSDFDFLVVIVAPLSLKMSLTKATLFPSVDNQTENLLCHLVDFLTFYKNYLYLSF